MGVHTVFELDGMLVSTSITTEVNNVYKWVVGVSSRLHTVHDMDVYFFMLFFQSCTLLNLSKQTSSFCSAN